MPIPPPRAASTPKEPAASRPDASDLAGALEGLEVAAAIGVVGTLILIAVGIVVALVAVVIIGTIGFIRSRARDRRVRAEPVGDAEPPCELRPGEHVLHDASSQYGGWAAITVTDQRILVQTARTPKAHRDRYSIELADAASVAIKNHLPDFWSATWWFLTSFARTPGILVTLTDGGHRFIAAWRPVPAVKAITAALAARTAGEEETGVPGVASPSPLTGVPVPSAPRLVMPGTREPAPARSLVDVSRGRATIDR